MAEKNNATCGICGKGYYACRSCKASISLHPFKLFTDTAEHYKVFQVVRGYSTGVYTKDEARERFKNVDLQDLEDYMPHIKKIIKDILKEDKSAIEVIEVIGNVENVEDTFEIETMTEENAVVEKPANSRKRSYKTDSK